MANEHVVAIVGGGLVGSLASIYLSLRGYTVHLYERRADIRQASSSNGIEDHRSINLALSTRGISALQKVGIADEILATAMPMKGRMVHPARESPLDPLPAAISLPYSATGETINSVDRRLLNCILLDRAAAQDNVKFFFEHECVSIDFATGDLTVLDRKTDRKIAVNATFVLACDGAFSTIRREMMLKTRMKYEQEFIKLGYKELRIPADATSSSASNMPAFKAASDHLHIWPREQFLLLALPNQDGSFGATFFYPQEKFQELNSRETILALFEREFPDAVEMIGQDQLVEDFLANPVGSLVSIKCNPYYYKDKVLLLGDAAHAMVPFYGQGVNAGFEDLLLLDELLDTFTDDLEQCFATYTARRHPDATAICDLAMANYHELSSRVASPIFRLRSRIYAMLHRIAPKWIVPLYDMVSFSRMPYGKVVQRHARQERLLNGALAGSVLGAVALAAAVSFLGHFKSRQ